MAIENARPYGPRFFTGDTVKVIDTSHAMVGWVGIVTSQRMWDKPHYLSIPFDHYRIEMDSGEGKFYGDYSASQLALIKSRK